MSPQAIQAIVTLGVELLAAGVQVNALIEEARANGGKLSDETLARVKAEVDEANRLWNQS